ncbi:hypothetical protein K2173_014112 [Erythroxylum novogranatense]|uniref:Protein LYK2 n=1 Tax=Erythroxylum novogranatense TaxID=1862640 RepID=A0AAV8SDG4_9ROSI|nr:hypothetical protein K2173_014112 [Erythroxylum novogranatense]
MEMAALLSLFNLIVLVFSTCLLVPILGENSLSCETQSPDAWGYTCNGNGSLKRCETFAVLRTNSYFSSLSNLSFYLGLNRLEIAKANGFSADTEFLLKDQPLLIPIDCKCSGGILQAEVTKTTIKGESFLEIAESLEGLTTCKAIRAKNLAVSPWNLANKVRLVVPLLCACPSSSEANPATRFLLSYPVSQGDTISKLAINFNTTTEAIIKANNRSSATFKPENLIPHTTLLVPLNAEPTFGPFAKPSQPNSRFPASTIPIVDRHKKKSKMRMIGVYIAVSGVVVGVSIAIAAAFLVIQLKKKKQQSSLKEGDLELQQLSLSVRTTSEKKVSFEGSQGSLNEQIVDTTPRKLLVEIYTIEELKKATDDFDSSNHIEGSVYHGRLNGKDLAVKRTRKETMSKIEFSLFNNSTCHHPKIVRLLGTCSSESPDSYLVFEYAKNGSLKDWLHGGLAIKSHFIASCDCFLTWTQRLKICLDVAAALQYMHHIMKPSYVHRNLKSRNIFLDEEFNAKIGNFGMQKCLDDDTKGQEHHETNPAYWNLGYLAPEYVHQGKVSPSMDIFAYGVVLLEVLSGRPNKSGEDNVLLSEKIKSILLSENADELREWIDTALGENYAFDAAITLANLARACVEVDPSLRPSSGEIVEKLMRLVQESAAEEHAAAVCESSSKPLVM